jgi:hypothetical protein
MEGKMHVWVTQIKHALSFSAILVTAILVAGCGASVDSLEIGDRAPSFRLPTAAGSEVALDDYTGDRPVLLFFHMAVG